MGKPELNRGPGPADVVLVGTDSPALAGTLMDLRPRTLLHFLALTRKTGRLHVHHDLHHPTVWLRDGEAVAVDHDPLDSVFEMLRMGNADFGFDEVAPPVAEDAEGVSVAGLLEEAGAQLAELQGAAQVVPSMSVTIVLRHCDDEVRLSADAWNVSMAVAAGETTPQRVAGHLRWGVLRTCRAVKELVDADRAELSPPVRTRPAIVLAAPPVAAAPALWPGGGDTAWRAPWYDSGE